MAPPPPYERLFDRLPQSDEPLSRGWAGFIDYFPTSSKSLNLQLKKHGFKEVFEREPHRRRSLPILRKLLRRIIISVHFFSCGRPVVKILSKGNWTRRLRGSSPNKRSSSVFPRQKFSEQEKISPRYKITIVCHFVIRHHVSRRTPPPSLIKTDIGKSLLLLAG